jgi:hypothetical protein
MLRALPGSYKNVRLLSDKRYDGAQSKRLITSESYGLQDLNPSHCS